MIFELAAFVATHTAEDKPYSGEHVRKAYMQLAEKSASDLARELQKKASSVVHKQGEQEMKELTAKMAMCHYLVIITCGCPVDAISVQIGDSGPYAKQLCKHMVMMRVYFLSGISNSCVINCAWDSHDPTEPMRMVACA